MPLTLPWPLGATGFKGFTIPDVAVHETQCHRCENACRITVAERDGQRISWGYLCGREDSQRQGRRPNPSLELVRGVQRGYQTRLDSARRRFKIPALALYEGFSPFWQAIGSACAIEIEVCYPAEDEIRQELAHIGTGDFCYPIKVAMAATQVVLRHGERVILPALIQDEKDTAIRPRSLYCPFISGFGGFYAGQVLSPVIDFSRSARWQARRLKAFLTEAGVEGLSLARLTRAVRQGRADVLASRSEIARQGRAILEAFPPDEKVIVLLGRPYNLYHRLLNLGIPELIESLGYRVITMDCIPDTVSNAEVVKDYPDLYWYQGQRLLRKARAIRNALNLFPVMLSNFSCGPDSFILSYFEEISRDKPYLILELDEHGSAAGYQTRIEAFLDMVAHYQATPRLSETKPLRIRYAMRDIRGHRLWIPQIHPYIPDLWAAMLQRHGYDARALGEERQCDCDLGRAFCRGSECLPAALTIGRFIDNVRADPQRDVLIMPRANGPCRYGQYATLHSHVMDRVGLADALIFSPTSEDGYAFFTPRVTRDAWKTLCLGDMLFKLRCRSVPYHPTPPQAARIFDQALQDLCDIIRQGGAWQDYVRDLVKRLMRTVDYAGPRRPLVGIVGEIFVRLNRFSNQRVTEVIEAAGGEVWLSPMSEWMFYVVELLRHKRSLADRFKAALRLHWLHRVEEELQGLFDPLLSDLKEPPVGRIIEAGSHFLPAAFEGEAILTLGRAKLFAGQGASLIVNCAPFGCMPGRITSYLFQGNPAYCGVPIVNLFFDGTGDAVSRVALYLDSLADRDARDQRRPVTRSRFRIGPRPQGTGAPERMDSLNKRRYE